MHVVEFPELFSAFKAVLWNFRLRWMAILEAFMRTVLRPGIGITAVFLAASLTCPQIAARREKASARAIFCISVGVRRLKGAAAMTALFL